MEDKVCLSLDASTTCIGWSIFKGDDLLDYGKLVPTMSDLEWRERIQDFIPQLHNVMKEHKPKKVYVEDVPLFKTKGTKTLMQLGAVQGSILGICGSHGVEVQFIPVSTWRSDIGLYDGSTEGKERDNLKQHSIEKANELFGLDLKYVSKSSKKNDDDISDSILIYASTREKYNVEKVVKRAIKRIKR